MTDTATGMPLLDPWDALEALARKEAHETARNRDHAWELLGKINEWESLAVYGAVTRAERWLGRPLTLGEKRRFAAEMYQAFAELP